MKILSQRSSIPCLTEDTLSTKICGFPLFETCEREEHENDSNAVAIIWDDRVSKNIEEHVLLNWSKVASKFQSWCFIGSRNTCKLFNGDAKIITWVKNSLEKLDN